MKRKRAPGAGRKPKGAFSGLKSPLSIRMQPEMRKRLESSAEENGWSLTQELLWRLQDSFDQDRNFSSSDPAARALAFLFDENLNFVCELCEIWWANDDRRCDNWHLDRFTFRMFRVALCKLLEALEPKGEIRPPFDWKKFAEDMEPEIKKDHPKNADLSRASVASWKSPEARAEYIANSIWSSLQRTVPTIQEIEVDQMWRRFGGKAPYGMSDVRRDLKLMSNGKREGAHSRMRRATNRRTGR